ncbi:hypothetical protein F4808DRAFT_444616 [Astrocystis sublimbata]|nr:hypothetical protein F4808DRAFT_444616 [Astrocystis sublimbata]
MASPGRRPSDGLTSRTDTEVKHCFTIPFREHFEQVTIQASLFQLHGSPKTFYGCKIQTLPCCLISLENEEAVRKIWSTCDSIFEVGHWLNITLDRSPTSPRCNADNHIRFSAPRATLHTTTSPPAGARIVSDSHLPPHSESNAEWQPAKRRRFNTVATDSEGSGLVSGTGASVCAREYVAKVKKGLLRIKTSKVLKPKHPYNIGLELLQCRLDKKANNKLIDILGRISKDFQYEHWQADFYYRYASYRRRC